MNKVLAALVQFSLINYAVIKKGRYGKVYQGGTIDGFKVTALDGSEVFRTKHKSWSCEKCQVTEIIKEDGSKELQYHENIVGAYYVGRHPNLVLGLERVARVEGETSEAMRLLKEMLWVPADRPCLLTESLRSPLNKDYLFIASGTQCPWPAYYTFFSSYPRFALNLPFGNIWGCIKGAFTECLSRPVDLVSKLVNC